MSGHNKWSSIKHKKGAADAKRGKVFTKVIREITVAARMGGGDINGNPRLRAAVALGKSENMPKDNIDRAIKKGTGELEGVSYEEANYEGYGPGGVAVLVDCLTDNKNRTVADVKHLFERYGGSLGEPGCVAYMFEKKGLIVIEKDKVDEEELLDLVLEAGAEDVKEEETEFNVITDASDFESVKKAVDDAGIPNTFAEVTMIPQNTVEVEGKKAQQIFNLIEALEDVDDVSNVYANFDMSDEVMEALG
jgi:YebC/PmpR family DNA-binding regulatory protein